MNNFTHLQEWFQLPDETKIRLFAETSRQIGLPSSSSAEKDWWVVQTLAIIFSMKCANALIFKGGTSLSKGWNVIHRFSEDIDLALVENPETLTIKIRSRLNTKWIDNQ